MEARTKKTKKKRSNRRLKFTCHQNKKEQSECEENMESQSKESKIKSKHDEFQINKLKKLFQQWTNKKSRDEKKFYSFSKHA